MFERIFGATEVASEMGAAVASTTELAQDMWHKAIVVAARIPVALLVLFVSWFIIGRYKKVLRAMLTRGKMDPIMMNLVLSVAAAAGWVVTISLVLSVLGFNTIAIALSGSLGLVALGLASSASSVVSDLYGGISLIAESSVKVGQRIKAAGVEGRVIDMSIRKLRLMDDVGNIHIIPNTAVNAGTIVVIAEKDQPKG